MENTTLKDALSRLVVLALIIAGLYLFFRVFDIGEIQLRIEEAGVWAPLLLIIAKASTIVIAPLTGSPLYPIAGALFGFWKGFVLLVIGDTLGGAIAFYLSRLLGRSVVEKLLSGQQNLVSEALSMMGTVRGFLLARLCFTTFPEIPAFAGGLSRIPFIPFILIYSLVGAIPTAVTTSLGAFLTSDNNPLVFGAVFLFGAVVSGVSLVIFIRLLRRQVDSRMREGAVEVH